MNCPNKHTFDSMEVFYNQEKLSKYLSEYKEGKTIGFVPTMGALHEGHQSLIIKAKEECDIVVASVFVNPTQFNESSDYDKYPRTFEADKAKLEEVNCDILYYPDVDDIYQNETLETTPIDIGYLDTILEGEKRPGHYQGVVIVVEKLLLAVNPNKLYMGLKDYQQLMVIKKLIDTRGMNVSLIGCPTKRMKSGLAMSSRNTRLSDNGKEIAASISKCLNYICENAKNSKSPQDIIEESQSKFLSKTHFNTEYLEIRNAEDLSEINKWNKEETYVVLIATWLENVRLIDNMTFGLD